MKDPRQYPCPECGARRKQPCQVWIEEGAGGSAQYPANGYHEGRRDPEWQQECDA